MFSHPDLCDGYHQLPIYPPNHYKTAPSCCYGTYQFNFIAFEICNIPRIFKCIINTVFFDILNDAIIIYLDDILM